MQSKSCATDADHKLKTFNFENIEQSEFKTKSHSEIKNYFKNSVFSIENNKSFFKLWKKINKKYFIIVQMIKNIFSIFTFDVDIKQLFNTARNVCHYHQNCLNANTIEIIILLKWYEKLKLAIVE